LGQFDSIPATLLVGMIYAFSVNRKMTAVVLYAIAVLTKPQSALLTPLGILFYKELFDFSNITKEKIVKSIKETLVAICVGLSCYFIVIYPFYYHTDLYERMKSTSVVKDFMNNKPVSGYLLFSSVNRLHLISYSLWTFCN